MEHSSSSSTLIVIFWIMLLLSAIGGWVIPDANPYSQRGRFTLILLLILILGLKLFGLPS